MNGIADIKLTGEELTKEVQKGIDAAKTEEGFAYRVSPLQIFSKMETIMDKFSKLEAFCEKYESMKSQLSELKSYSRVTSWNELLLAVPKAISEVSISDPQDKQAISVWLSDYQSVASEDGMRDAIRDLEDILNKLPKKESELICNKVNSLFNQFHEVGGEFFIVHNYRDVDPSTLPFSKPQSPIQLQPTGIEVETQQPGIRSYSRHNRNSNRTQEVTVHTETYGARLKRMFGGR